MNVRPDALELLEATYAAIGDQLLPHLSAEQRHTALMARNAIGIVRRMLGAGAHEGSDADLATWLAEFRSGVRDPGTAAGSELHAALLTRCQQLVAMTNPKQLEREATKSGG
jgi:hypothetical protein